MHSYSVLMLAYLFFLNKISTANNHCFRKQCVFFLLSLYYMILSTHFFFACEYPFVLNLKGQPMITCFHAESCTDLTVKMSFILEQV